MTCTAFAGRKRIASGDLRQVGLKAKTLMDRDKCAQVLIFNDLTSELIEVDFRGTPRQVSARLAEMMKSATRTGEPVLSSGQSQGPGRPKLGVVAREVTLLPRHWEWLAIQPGGASVALRKLVEQARLANQGRDRRRRAQDSAYRFLSAMAGNEAGFEEAIRALFAGNQEKLERIVMPWPIDIRNHARKLAAVAFEASDSANPDCG